MTEIKIFLLLLLEGEKGGIIRDAVIGTVVIL